jgi:hypothetical protein
VLPAVHSTIAQEDFLTDRAVDCFPFLAPLSDYLIWSYIFLSKGFRGYEARIFLSQSITAHSPQSHTQIWKLIDEEQDLVEYNWHAIYS